MNPISFYTFTINGKHYDSPHDGQKEILESTARYKVVCCGRRFGKTILAINTLLEHSLNNSNHTYWYIGPTFRQAKTIAWRFLMSRLRLLPRSYRKKIKINATELSIEFPNGTILELKGVERPDNLLGTGLNGVVLDEYATETFGTYPIWKEIIRPSLSDTIGWAIIISTPRGYNHFYDLYNFAETGKDSDWEAWRMPSSRNPVLSKKELEAAKREIGEDLFSQEYEAEFKKRSGLVYSNFDRNIHLLDNFELSKDTSWGLEVGIDFGGDHPTAAVFVLFRKSDDTAYIVDEYYERGLSFDKHAGGMKAIEDKWLSAIKQHRPRVRWGDSQAKQSIIDYGRLGYHITPCIKGEGSVEAGINAVRKRLDPDIITQKPKLYILNNCVNTLREFENYAYMTDSAIEEDETLRMAVKRKDAPRKVFDDAMDALRYVISHHIPAGNLGPIKPARRRERDPLTGF